MEGRAGIGAVGSGACDQPGFPRGTRTTAPSSLPGCVSKAQAEWMLHEIVGDLDEQTVTEIFDEVDSDGDGKVEKWELEVFERIKAADEDNSGSINVKELFGVIKGAAESDKQKRLFQKLLGVAMILIIALVGAMLGVSIAAGEAIKESHVNAAGQATTLDGSPLTVSVTTGAGVGVSVGDG